VEKSKLSDKKAMSQQTDCASVSKTGAKHGSLRRRATLQNPNGWQSTSSNRTARMDAPGRLSESENDQLEVLIPMHVGIDVSKDYLDAHVHETALSFRVANDEDGIKKLLTRLRAM
jgi:hypothetical protein